MRKNDLTYCNAKFDHIPKVIDCPGYQNKNVSTFLPPQAGVVPRREHFPPHAAEIRKDICFKTTVYPLIGIL